MKARLLSSQRYFMVTKTLSFTSILSAAPKKSPITGQGKMMTLFSFVPSLKNTMVSIFLLKRNTMMGNFRVLSSHIWVLLIKFMMKLIIHIREISIHLSYSQSFYDFPLLDMLEYLNFISILFLAELSLIILRKYRALVNLGNKDGMTPLHLLASKPSTSKSGNDLRWFENIIYHCKYFISKAKIILVRLTTSY